MGHKEIKSSLEGKAMPKHVTRKIVESVPLEVFMAHMYHLVISQEAALRELSESIFIFFPLGKV